MSAAAWMRQQRDRPIAEHERRAAMTAVVVLLIAVAVLLALTQPASRAVRDYSRNAQTTPADTAVEPHNLALISQAEQTARRFLNSYLAYAYGQAPASRIVDATPALIDSLQAHPPRVPPAARARRPRVLSLHPAAVSTGEIAVTAVVNDGGLTDYSVGLVLASEGGRLLVSGLERA